MSRPKIQPTDLVVPFNVEDLIFSTTDRKGIIRSADDVFVHMSRYSAGDMLGQPHSLVRHPDMPRAIFHLFWNYLKQGKPVGAYVKNMASDGAMYHVFALASPLRDGYISIRLKPTSKYHPIIQDVYRSLKDLELSLAAEGKTTAECIEASTALLSERLNELGFADYDAFMFAALEEEIRCRDALIHEDHGSSLWERDAVTSHDLLLHPDDKMIQSVLHLQRACEASGTLFNRVGALLELQNKLTTNATSVINVSKTFEMSSINVSLEATRLREQARCLGVIANHLSESSQTVCSVAQAMQSQIGVTSGSLGGAIFRIAAVRLQIETMLAFTRKSMASGGSSSGEMLTLYHSHPRQQMSEMLADLLYAIESLQAELRPTMNRLINDLGALESNITSVKRSMLMMRFAQLGGKIESSRLDSDNDISTLVESIGEDIANTVRQISELETDVSTVASDLQMSYRQFDVLDQTLGDVHGTTGNRLAA